MKDIRHLKEAGGRACARKRTLPGLNISGTPLSHLHDAELKPSGALRERGLRQAAAQEYRIAFSPWIHILSSLTD